jgi:S1-C subfamily serine protease
MKLDGIEERPAGVPKDGMALKVAHVGMYGGPHGAAKAAGVQVGDTLVAFDGKTNLLRETDVFAYSLRTHAPGDKVTIKLVRNGKPLEVVIPMQP